MKKLFIKIFFMVILGLVTNHSASANSYFAIYSTYLNYNNSEIKDNGYSLTAYSNLWNMKYGLELGISQTHINYKKGFDDLDQTDFTTSLLKYNFLDKNLLLKFGFHYISSDDDLTDNGKIYFADITYYIPYVRNYGLEIAYSNYNEVHDLNIIQLSPHAGFFIKKLYLEVRGYYIHTNKEDKIGLNLKNFYSIESAISYQFNNFITKIEWWLGQQVFAVKKGGFIVYNLSEKYKGGLTLDISYNLNKKTKLGFIGSWNTYKEITTDNEVNQLVGTIFMGLTF